MNKYKLLVCLAENGETRKELAEVLGISIAILSKKMSENDDLSFTQSEISTIKHHYRLTSEQIDAIFFDSLTEYLTELGKQSST